MTLTRDDFEVSCSIETPTDPSPGDTIGVDVDIEGFSTDTNSYDVFIDLLVNGEAVASGSGNVTPNGGVGVSFEVELPETGEYSIDHDVAGWDVA